MPVGSFNMQVQGIMKKTEAPVSEQGRREGGVGRSI